jgi:hypothetical protein
MTIKLFHIELHCESEVLRMLLLLLLSALLVSLVAAAAITGEDAAQAKKFAIGDTALVVVTMTPTAAPNAPNPFK